MPPNDPWLPDRMTSYATIRRAENMLHTAVRTAVSHYLTQISKNVRVPPPVAFSADPDFHGFPRESVWRRLVNQYVLPAARRVWSSAFARYNRTTTGDDSSYTSGLADRLAGFRERVLERLHAAVSQGLSHGETTAQLQQRVRDLATLEHWDGQVMTMTRTETICALNAGALAGALEEQRRTGQTWMKRWQATADDRVRDSHREADGQLHPLNKPFTVGRAHLQFPGDPQGPPEETINCRCALRLAPAGDHSLTAAAPLTVPPKEETPMPRSDDPEHSSAAAGHWRGVLGLMNAWSADRRMLAAPQSGESVRSRPLPLPLLVQPELANGHDGARLGVGVIDQLWTEGGMVMGAGRFDMEDPIGAELARKVGEGFVRFVSLDVDDATANQVCLDTDGQTILENCNPADPSLQFGQVYSGWRVMGATLLAHPAFPEAHIALATANAVTAAADECVAPDQQSPTGWAPAPCDTPDAVPANNNGTAPADTPPDQPAQDDQTPIPDDDTTTPEQADELEDEGTGCVAPDENGTWVQVPCDAEGAVPADETGQAPAPTTPVNQLATADAPYQPVPLADDLQGTDCVCPDPETGWKPCDCQNEGAQPAGPDGKPAQPTSDQRNTVTITAAASPPTHAPGFAPPAEWFEAPRASTPYPITVNVKTGRLSGYLAPWDQCHLSYEECVLPPRSTSDYSYFRTATITTSSGPLNVGLVTMDTSHADINAPAFAAAAHYENTGAQAAVISVGEDQHGIWAAGACLPWITEHQRLRLSLAQFSGDWRQIRSSMELVAALAVNTGGFPMKVSRTGEDNQPYALVASCAWATSTQQAPAPSSVDQEAVRSVVRAELARHEGHQRRRAAATASLAALRNSHNQNRLNAAQASIGRISAKKAHRPRADEIPMELAGLGPLPNPSTHDIHLAKNWVDKHGGLPPYIKRISKHLQEKGMPESRAIATAVNVVKRMCRSGDLNFPGRQNVNPKSRAQACAAVARWEAMKKAARAD